MKKSSVPAPNEEAMPSLLDTPNSVAAPNELGTPTEADAPVKKKHLIPDILKSILYIVLSSSLLAAGTYAWFRTEKVPNALDLQINDPTAMLRVEQFDPDNSTYSLLYEEPQNDVSTATFSVNLPEMTFFKWEGSVVSDITEKLYYRITVTSRFSTAHFSVDPLLCITPFCTVSSSQPLLAGIKIIKADYLALDPSAGAPPANSFPSAGFTAVPLGVSPGTTLTIPKVRTVSISGGNRYQSVIYIVVDSDKDAVAGVIDQLVNTLEGHTAMNSLTMSFGFRSTPYYEPPVSSAP